MLQQDRAVRAAGPGYPQCFTAPLQSCCPWVGLFCQRVAVGCHSLRFGDQTGFDAYRRYFKVLWWLCLLPFPPPLLCVEQDARSSPPTLRLPLGSSQPTEVRWESQMVPSRGQ